MKSFERAARDDYSSLLRQLKSVMEDESDGIANAANLGAFVFENIPNLNWVGFYFLRDDQLVVGPFQGKIACTRIPIGKGVCGTAFKENRVLNVPDVSTFSGHIACDSASKSELVIPLYKNGRGIGVLDIDSPMNARFDESLANFFSEVAKAYLEKLQ